MKAQEQEYEKICAYCEYGIPLCGIQDRLLCRREGVVSAGYHCGKFSFDPVKRKPAPKPVPQDLGELLAMADSAEEPRSPGPDGGVRPQE